MRSVKHRFSLSLSIDTIHTLAASLLVALLLPSYVITYKARNIAIRPLAAGQHRHQLLVLLGHVGAGFRMACRDVHARSAKAKQR